MPRSARIVIPNLPHHITQRGNRQQTLFYSDADYSAYIDILQIALARSGTRCLAWCLMPNHVHLMLVPQSEDGLRAALSRTHTTYAQRLNREQQASGHVFQGRFASYVMDDAHMMVAAQYIENNPVKAGLVKTAQDWRWSSAAAHVSETKDPLCDPWELGQHIKNWSAMLQAGLEASDQNDAPLAALEASMLSGAPLADERWITKRGLARLNGKRGRPRKS